MIKAVVRASHWRDMLARGDVKSAAKVARKVGCPKCYVYKMLPLVFLSSDIIEDILQSTQPRHLTLAHLVGMDLPRAWPDQLRQLGSGLN